MPKGPQGQKRPADFSQLAHKVLGIAVSDDCDAPIDDGKDPAAKALGGRGGAAAGVSQVVWSMEDLLAMTDAYLASEKASISN